MLKRILVAMPLIALLAGVLVFDGLFRVIAFAVFTLMSAYEMAAAIRKMGYEPFMYPVYFFAVAYYPAAVYIGQFWSIVLMGLCMVASVTERIINKKRSTVDCLMSLMIYLYPMLLFVFLMLICCINDPAISRTALFITFAGPLMGDTMAYFIGKLFGKRKLCEEISPKKTVAGSIAGLFGGVLGGLIVFWIQCYWNGATGIVPLMVLGFVCGGMGQIGDLFASSLKRFADIKDFGRVFPGHGGVLDRIDSVLMCAPLVFAYFYAVLGAGSIV